jgi:DNA polymerase-1
LCHNPYPFGISLAFPYNDKVVLVWARHTDTKLYAQCLKLVASNVTKVWHNSRYDLRVLKENNLPVGGTNHCTLTMSRIYWDRRKNHKLQALTEFLCPQLSGWEVELKRQMRNLKAKYTREGYPEDYVTYSHLPHETVEPYAMVDVFMTLMLHLKLKPIMEQNFQSLYWRERRIITVVLNIERRGLRWNIKQAKKEISKLEPRELELKDKLLLYTVPVMPKKTPSDWEVPVNYYKNVLNTLHSFGIKDNQLKLKGKVTTEADVLNRLLKETDNERVKDYLLTLLEYRAYVKTLGTYLRPLTEIAERNKGIVYTSINPAETRVGRMSSSDPNLQNQPNLHPRRGRTAGDDNPVKSCFICRRGYANYYFDYANMELVVFGCYAEEPLILDTYAAGGDVHGVMAAELYGKNYDEIQRNRTKDTNFGVIYGMGIGGMATAREVSRKEAERFYNMYLRTFPSIRQFQESCEYELRQYGYVEDWFGKRYTVPVGKAYVAVSAIIAGTCAQAFKVGLLNLVKNVEFSVDKQSILLLIHDECQIERKKALRGERAFVNDVTDQMTDIPQFLERGLRLRVDVAKSVTNWAEKQPLEI